MKTIQTIPATWAALALLAAGLGAMTAARADTAAVHTAALHQGARSELPLHDHVVHLRANEQRRWIRTEVRHHQLDSVQAASLRSAVAGIEHEQHALHAAHHETVAQALAISHRQDVLDWAIRGGHTAFEPQRLVNLDAADVTRAG